MIVAGGLTAALVQRKTIRREHLQTGMALALITGLALAALTLVAASSDRHPDLRCADGSVRPADGAAVSSHGAEHRADGHPAVDGWHSGG